MPQYTVRVDHPVTGDVAWHTVDFESPGTAIIDAWRSAGLDGSDWQAAAVSDQSGAEVWKADT